MNIPTYPHRYSPDLDKLGADEKQTAEAISKTMIEIADKTFADSGHAIRSVHAKSHGILKGKFEVLPVLPKTLAQGLFAKPATYAVVMRFSRSPVICSRIQSRPRADWRSRSSVSMENALKARSGIPPRIS
jgi:hypothetical protein